MQNAGQNTGAEAGPTGQEQGPMGAAGGVPQGPQALGATGTGGGNIGTGSVPQSGEDEFAGTVRAVT